MAKDLEKIQFEEIDEKDFLADYTAGCSGGRSDCCTRTCTNKDIVATEKEWGQFLNVEGGVIQY